MRLSPDISAWLRSSISLFYKELHLKNSNCRLSNLAMWTLRKTPKMTQV